MTNLITARLMADKPISYLRGKSPVDGLGKDKLDELLDSSLKVKDLNGNTIKVKSKECGHLASGEAYLVIEYKEVNYLDDVLSYVCLNGKDYQYIACISWLYEKAGGAEKIREVQHKMYGGERLAFTQWESVIKFNSLWIERCLYDSAINTGNVGIVTNRLKELDAEMDKVRHGRGSNYTPRSAPIMKVDEVIKLLKLEVN